MAQKYRGGGYSRVRRGTTCDNQKVEAARCAWMDDWVNKCDRNTVDYLFSLKKEDNPHRRYDMINLKDIMLTLK